jgi:pimeloyl-ACP methyl ester carboxylesterase
MGEEDPLVSVGDGELMRRCIAGSGLAVIPKAGHYTP